MQAPAIQGTRADERAQEPPPQIDLLIDLFHVGLFTANAWLTPAALAQLRALGLHPRAHLDDNDSAGGCGAVQSLRVTGPTHTHITDFRAILVEAA